MKILQKIQMRMELKKMVWLSKGKGKDHLRLTLLLHQSNLPPQSMTLSSSFSPLFLSDQEGA